MSIKSMCHSRSRRVRRPRGFTLLELVVAGAVGLLVLAAGVAAFNFQNQLLRHTEKMLSLNTATRLGLDIMQRDLENAGFKWSWPVAAVIPYDNINAPLDGGAMPVAPFDGKNMVPSAVSGTDAFEVWSGYPPPHVAGFLLSATIQGSSVTAALQSGGMGLTNADLGMPFLVVNPDSSYCVLQVSAYALSPVPIVTLQALPGGLPAFPNALTLQNCIKPGTTATAQPSGYVLSTRKRYLVYQGVNGSDLGLYVQTAGPGSGGVLGPPQLIVDGVEDMQVSWGMWNSRVAGQNPLGCGAGSAICWCNDVGSAAACDGTVSPNLIRLARVRLTSRGFSRPNDVDLTPGAFRPASFNHPASTSIDNVTRVQLQSSVNFNNFPMTGLVP